ncbi:MAG: pentapeptide repeat-containing protein [Planctomycetes bacterium]|nr:pentapeptide repeat-containing protein [Planctomycetota bacterium]
MLELGHRFDVLTLDRHFLVFFLVGCSLCFFSHIALVLRFVPQRAPSFTKRSTICIADPQLAQRPLVRPAWLKSRANLDSINLERANLERANLERANLDKAHLHLHTRMQLVSDPWTALHPILSKLPSTSF